MAPRTHKGGCYTMRNGSPRSPILAQTEARATRKRASPPFVAPTAEMIREAMALMDETDEESGYTILDMFPGLEAVPAATEAVSR